ncbi:MAG: APC family permease [Candidatus Micrarchaeia archaeon]
MLDGMSENSRNSISVPAATAIGLGAIIGAGIFVLSGTAIALAGSYAILAFLLVGIVALFVALEMGALGKVMPHAKGASYSFVYNAFGSELGFITGITMYFSFATSISAISLGFGSYLSSMLGFNVQSYSIPFAIVLIFVLSLLNIIGIRKAAKSDSVLVMVKLSILALFVVFGIAFALSHGGISFMLQHFASTPKQSSISAIFAASVAIFFAYSGFQSISTITDKVKGGAKGAAKSIMYAVAISLVVYVLVVIALIALAPVSSYSISADPLSTALKYSSAPSWLFILVDLGALVATASATIAMILSSSRLFYQIGEDKLLPKFSKRYNPKSDVATNGVIISSLIGILMLFSGNIYVIAAISNFGLLFAYLLTSFAAIHYKRQLRESFELPAYPYIPIIAVIALIIFLVGMPREALVIGSAMIMSLLAIYYFLRELKGKKVVKVKLFE